MAEGTKRLAVFRFVLSALLFLGWLGWLAYLTTTLAHPVVLSRPQLLMADLDVLAQVEKQSASSRAPKSSVAVVEVAWARDANDKSIKSVTVENLAEFGSENGWEGPGLYILPLVKQKGDDGLTRYKIAPTGRSPGYPSGKTGLFEASGPPRIYSATANARRQLERIRNGQWE